MIKISIILSLLFLLAYSQTCNKTKTCSLRNGECSGTFGGGKCDPSSNCCPMYEYCLKKTCTQNTNGMSCTNDTDCFSDQLGTRLYKCSKSGRCISIFNRGDKCNGNETCYGGMNCDANLGCVGFGLGQPCLEAVYKESVKAFTGFSCGIGLYCNASQLCAPTLGPNDNCTSNVQCAMGFLCNTKTSKCTEAFSLDDGKECDQDDLCKEDRVCGPVGKCIVGDLRAVPTICQDDSACGTGESCGPCNDFTGRRYCNTTYHNPAVNCRKEAHDALKCYLDNNCTTYFAFEVGTCQHDNCLSYMQSVWYCKMCIPNQDELGDCYGRFDVAGHCLISLPLYIVAIIIGGLTIVLIILFFIFIKIGDACNGKESSYNLIN